MNSIKIKNFGPIKEGFTENNGFIDIKKITIFIGNQGSGKSSIAKLISIFSWLSKSLIRGELTEKEIIKSNKFKNSYCAYQNIHNYFKQNTEIEYYSDNYHFKYEKENLNISKLSVTDYLVPKILYIPAERSFLSAVNFRDLEKIKELPRSLFSFLEELEHSQMSLIKPISLPIGNSTYEFDKLNKISKITTNGIKLRLSETSSGFQSIVPLFLVSNYIANSINEEKNQTTNELNSKQQKIIEKETNEILRNNELSNEVKMAALKILSTKFKNKYFINIVEEPEQNLFPSSQQQLINKLLEFANINKNNKLIITTHSPHIINFLTIAVQAEYLKSKIKNSNKKDAILEKIKQIIPSNSTINATDLVIYQLDNENSIITKLPNYDGIPSDNNYLNNSLADCNKMFDKLLEIEDEL